MPRRPSYRPQRRRFFVACEGESEEGYVALLQRLADEAGLALYLDIRICRGGDPLAIVESAVRELNARRIRRGAYVGQAIFLDADRRGDVPGRTACADRLLHENGFHGIWSEPAFEALLLIHLPGCERLRPATTALALEQLQDQWAEYRKGMTASDLHTRLDRAAVERAAVVLPELREFFTKIQLLPLKAALR